MREYNMKNPVLLITKGYINKTQVEELASLKLNLVILYTFSGLSEILENRSEKEQIETMKNISQNKSIKLINYYRPVIEGINSSEECIEHVAKIVSKYCSASIISGIRLNTYLCNVLDKLGIYIPKEYDPDHKVLLPETFNRVNDVFERVDSNYPTFKKTSCGISYILKRPDYNGHSARIYYCNPTCKSYNICIGTSKIGFCKPNCPNFKRCKEESEKIVTKEQFRKLLKKIDAPDAKFSIEEHYIKLEGEYWQEEVSYLRHVTKKNIKADSLKKREDEKLISM